MNTKTLHWAIAAAACVAFLFLTAATHAEDRVFLLAGQSNMSGAGLYDKLKETEKEPPAGVKIWHKGAWQKLGPGISANEGRFGPELAFGRAMRVAFPDDDIYLIKTAAGGTSMHKHWKFEDGRGPMLRRFLNASKAAVADLDKANVKYKIEGMLWMQGESDAAQGKGAEYEASLKSFINEIRREFKRKDLPFVMGRILPTFDKPEGNGPMVRAAQAQVAKELKKVALFDTDKFERINKGHYNHNGQITLGKTFAEHLLKIISSEK